MSMTFKIFRCFCVPISMLIALLIRFEAMRSGVSASDASFLAVITFLGALAGLILGEYL